jgi:hypothetical protein
VFVPAALGEHVHLVNDADDGVAEHLEQVVDLSDRRLAADLVLNKLPPETVE